MSKPSASIEIAALIKCHGGTLIRHKKHEIWRFPDGKTFVQSCTPSDCHAEDNALRDLNRILGVNGDRGTPGERRERKVKGRRAAMPKASSVVPYAVLEKKLAESERECDSLSTTVDAMQEFIQQRGTHIDRLVAEMTRKDKAIRRYKRKIASMRSLWGFRLGQWVHGWLSRLLR